MGDISLSNGLLDFRDVGESVSSAGGLQPGKLFRTLSIDQATKQDRAYLQRTLGLSSLINLSGPPPRYVPAPDDPSVYKPEFEDRIHNYQILDLNILETAIESPAYIKAQLQKVSWKTTMKGIGAFITCRPTEIQSLYLRALDSKWDPDVAAREILALSKPQIKAVFDVLADTAPSAPVLIYGPRVGVVICLILALLSVPTETIAQEYHRSEGNAEAIFAWLNSNRRAKGIEEKDWRKESEKGWYPEEFVWKLMGHLEREYRGVEVYLAGIGLTHNTLQSVKNNLRGGQGGNTEKLAGLSIDEKLVDL